MEHVLDNPAWHALLSGNKNLSNGSNQVKYFDKEVSPFVGLKENSAENFKLLHQLLPHNGPVAFISPFEMKVADGWKQVQYIKCLQMVCEQPTTQTDDAIQLQPLTLEHVPQMLALTKLTNPGPFAPRTIEMGHYMGIFDGEKLVAMAGQRMFPSPYAEISAVCTHPDYLGKGYARQLLLSQVQRIKEAQGVAFLHVRFDNHRAIKVYNDLGFVTRKELEFYIIQKQ